jgi:beta-lactamase class A
LPAACRAIPSRLMLLLLALVLAVAPSPQTIAAPAGGTVGFAAVDLASGRSLGMRENERFPLQSVFKVPVAIEVLLQADAGKLDLQRVIALHSSDRRDGNEFTMEIPAKRTAEQLLEAMLVNSDNIACDKLLSLIGGPKIVDARMKGLGIVEITIRSSERDLAAGRADNTATPAAIVALLAKIARNEVGLSAASAKRLDTLLLATRTGTNRIKGALPAGTPVAHKTGTSVTKNGKTDATNDIGLVTLPNCDRIAIAIFVHSSPADEETRATVISQLARAAYDEFNTPTSLKE